MWQNLHVKAVEMLNDREKGGSTSQFVKIKAKGL